MIPLLIFIFMFFLKKPNWSLFSCVGRQIAALLELLGVNRLFLSSFDGNRSVILTLLTRAFNSDSHFRKKKKIKMWLYKPGVVTGAPDAGTTPLNRPKLSAVHIKPRGRRLRRSLRGEIAWQQCSASSSPVAEVVHYPAFHSRHGWRWWVWEDIVLERREAIHCLLTNLTN